MKKFFRFASISFVGAGIFLLLFVSPYKQFSTFDIFFEHYQKTEYKKIEPLFQTYFPEKQQKDTIHLSKISPPDSLFFSFFSGKKITSPPEKERAIGIMIDNILTARKGQKNIELANVVFEALAEGGITRYLAIFSSYEIPSDIGPVRSTRNYFLDFQKPFGGLYLHAGGSDKAMEELKGISYFIDIDHGKFGNGQTSPFFRSSKYKKPHNLFINTKNLTSLFESSSPPLKNIFLFDEKIPNGGIPKKSFHISFKRSEYSSSWTWDEEKNIFLRNMIQSPFQFEAQNVIIIIAQHFSLPDDPKLRIGIDTIGSGDAYFFRNGQMWKGKWERATREKPFSFFDEENNVFPFLQGKTWISIEENFDIPN